MRNKILKNKFAYGLMSFATVIILISSILAASIFYQSNITARAIQETNFDSSPAISIIAVDNINGLNQLNEGWYEIRNGFVYYLQDFDTPIPLYIRIKNSNQQNGLLSVDYDGTIIFDSKFHSKNEVNENTFEEKIVATTISGRVTGLEKVSGFEDR